MMVIFNMTKNRALGYLIGTKGLINILDNGKMD